MSEAKILEHDPLTDSEKILRDEFYGRSEASPVARVVPPVGTPNPEGELVAQDSKPAKKAKPTHYKVVCISLYTQDIENLEEMVAELKRRGHTKANKSQLIRQALRQLDIDTLPPPQQ